MADDMSTATDTMSEEQPKDKPTTFLSLSAELRNKVYNHVLQPTDISISILSQIETRRNARYNKDKNLSLLPVPANTQVCRQVRADTMPIFFGINTFSAQVDHTELYYPVGGNLRVLKAWLDIIGHKRAGLIRNFKITVGLNPREFGEGKKAEPEREVILKDLGIGEAGIKEDVCAVEYCELKTIELQLEMEPLELPEPDLDPEMGMGMALEMEMEA